MRLSLSLLMPALSAEASVRNWENTNCEENKKIKRGAIQRETVKVRNIINQVIR
ncbi:hypothetical protein [Dyadobacter sediminis]|uniref:hypothetical protein n=1 Tax=Dyadobacter sediminis TaxID=1493691 RepID=UPI001E32F5A6|nr:hypothetical protein [Dyadobacter sediminis]